MQPNRTTLLLPVILALQATSVSALKYNKKDGEFAQFSRLLRAKGTGYTELPTSNKCCNIKYIAEMTNPHSAPGIPCVLTRNDCWNHVFNNDAEALAAPYAVFNYSGYTWPRDGDALSGAASGDCNGNYPRPVCMRFTQCPTADMIDILPYDPQYGPVRIDVKNDYIPPTTSPTITLAPSLSPTKCPVTQSPATTGPTQCPTQCPTTTNPVVSQSPVTLAPSRSPATAAPTQSPATTAPTQSPTKCPVTQSPTNCPTTQSPITAAPTASPTTQGGVLIDLETTFGNLDLSFLRAMGLVNMFKQQYSAAVAHVSNCAESQVTVVSVKAGSVVVVATVDLGNVVPAESFASMATLQPVAVWNLTNGFNETLFSSPTLSRGDVRRDASTDGQVANLPAFIAAGVVLLLIAAGAYCCYKQGQSHERKKQASSVQYSNDIQMSSTGEAHRI